MDKILLLLAVACAVIAITSGHRLHKNMEAAESDSTESMDQSLKADAHSPTSLTYALNKMTNTQVPSRPSPIPSPISKSSPQQELTKALQKEIETIQNSNADSPEAFERALNLTSAPENLALRLTVFQAALNMQYDSAQARSVALHEVTSFLVTPLSDSASGDDTSLHDLQRNVVTTAYKVYVMTSQDSDLVYNDTIQALSFQTDTWVRHQIVFECVSRFPQLRERINE